MGFHHQREHFARSLNYVHCFFDVSYTSSQKLTAIIMLQLFFFCINSLIPFIVIGVASKFLANFLWSWNILNITHSKWFFKKNVFSLLYSCCLLKLTKTNTRLH